MATINSIGSNKPVQVSFGGTGQSTLTQHGVLIGNATSGITQLSVGSNGQVLVGSTSADPAFATLGSSSLTYTTGAGSLSIDITAPVSIANGGTNATSMGTTDGVVYYDGTRLVTTTAGTATQVLTSNGPGVAPTFQAAGAGSSPVSLATVQLTSTQIKSIHGTPITIISAPGAGKTIAVLNICCKLNYGGSNVFTAGASQTLSCRYTNGTGTLIQTNIFPNAQIVASSNQVYINNQANIQPFAGAATSAENQAVIVWNPVSTEISGNAANDNTIDVQILYQTLTL